ncbi:MAG: DUF2815 family protein [Oscillospiraceae bacterium]|nr:DUF2815 family protein [Oscillospiraceae bacterium]
MTETTVTTDRARLSFTHLFEPYTNDPKQEAKYSVTVLVPKSDIATKQRIDAAITAAKQKGVAEKWNGVMPPVVATAVHDGDGVRPNGEPFGEECRGHWVFTASSKQPPQVVDINLNPIINQTDVYSGCYARVCVNFFAYNSNGKRGVGIGLNAVQKLEDGEPLGGRVSAAEAFGTPMGAAPQPQYQTFAPQQPAPVPQQYAPQAAPAQQQYPPQYNQPVQQPYFDPLTGVTYGG